MRSIDPDAPSDGQINYTSSGTAQQPGRCPGHADADIAAFKNRCDWFVVAPTLDGQCRICTKKDFAKVLGEDIVAGQLKGENRVRVYLKKGEAWDESTPLLRSFAQQHLKLQAVYEPVWAHAVTGFLWGAAAGIGLAILNALIYYGVKDPWVAICLAASILVLIVPRFGVKIAPFILGSLGLMGKVAPIFGVLAGILTFAVLGGLPGMTIGGAIGWVSEEKLPRAPDAPAEVSIVIRALVLPLIGWLLLWSFFALVVYPWAMQVAGHPFAFLRIPSQP
jgi:hypothetical protein